MKKLIFFFILVSYSFVFGQKSGFTLSGKVTDCKTNDSIKGVTIKLVGSDGSSIYDPKTKKPIIDNNKARDDNSEEEK